MNTLSFKGVSVGNTVSMGNAVSASPAVSSVISAFKQKRFPLEIDAINGALTSTLLTLFFQHDAGPYLVVAPTENEAITFSSDLESLGVPSRVFPWWGALPYRDLALSSPVFGERCALLSGLVRGKAPAIIASQRAFLTPLPPPEYLRKLLVTVKTSGRLDTVVLAALLVRYGYTRVPRVQVHGEFALRGEVLDIFMAGDDAAYRVQFDFNHVESIKRFDPQDQSGQEKVSELVIRPLKEVVWSDERIEALSVNLTAFDEFTTNGVRLLENLMEKRAAAGEELFFPLAFPQSATLLDYLGPNGTVIYLDRERLENAREAMEREYHKLFNLAIRTHEVPRPERILLEFRMLFQKAPCRVSFMTMTGGGEEGATRCSVASEPSRSFFGNINYLKEEFATLIQNSWRIFVAAESDVQARRIEELLSDFKAGSKQTKLKGQALTIMPHPLSAGFSLPDIKLIVIEENEIFGRRKRVPHSLKTAKSMAIDTFVELNPGDYVVHVNYGIGLFKGIERVKVLGNERDYIKLEYQDAEVVFVPIEQVNLVQRYIGNQGTAPRLDKLGSKSWENRKRKVKKSVEDIAEQLITLYSKRKQVPGFAFPRDTEWQTMFEAAFPYEETEDQLRCVEEIKADMENPHPMDRLVCGDVGYGKTEVAIRACFKAIMGGKQAAFLAPTTILAEQHFENFQERFTQFPVRIAMLSRFVEKSAVKKTLEAVKNGEIDLLVGTHRIIQKDVVFKNLGFMVIDEEQRFGVKDKERLKQFKTNVDCLTLSATPIPRTLHMSLLKIRDMSLLTTPPQNRRPIETVVEEYDEERVALAIRREVERGGQIFFLHNRIEDLDETRVKLERLVPEMLVDTAHGQMNAHELEDVMHRFIHGGFHVLVSTTIIENGIDIPNVNTIIIDRADMYGVSQLYQLRGRVGRSDRVAYAYLFYPKDRALSELAMKRLQVISDFTELGAGFKIAMKDMEIRGAGNLLGREQSGDIYSVGFDLYLRLLDEAIHRLEDEHYEAETETLMELEYTGFIPDSYIEGPQEKMEVYKKIAAVREKEELEHVYTELLDRFGPLPDEAASLLALAELRVLCRNLAIASLKERAGLVRVEFAKVSRMNVERLLRLIKESRGKVKLDPHAPNVLILTVGAIGLKEKSEFIREKLARLVS
ncbi:MAG: transcription-repair coupling factor [Treponema sp.]|jgi:transcription-repair coupling factor (superfamily II helicase)|nr:transcription-repair coupling factor [Treponema sp.]